MKTDDKLIIRTLNGLPSETVPVWFMRQAGRYLPEYKQLRLEAAGFLEFCYSPELSVEATLQPMRRYDLDAAIVFSDILVIPDALGQDVTFKDGLGPRLKPLRLASDIERLTPSSVIGHLDPVYKAIGLLKENLCADKTLIGFAGAPWTLAIYMVEGLGGTEAGNARQWAYKDPESFSKLIDILVVSISDHLIQQINHGVEVIQIFDSWAGVLAERQFLKWVIEPTSRIVCKIREVYPKIPIIGFPRGNNQLLGVYANLTKVNCVSIGSNVSLNWIKQNIQPLTTIQGNLDNQLLVCGGEQLDEEVLRIKTVLGSKPFIFNTGHGIVPETNPENISRAIEGLRGS